jgi:hypothetical protein
MGFNSGFKGLKKKKHKLEGKTTLKIAGCTLARYSSSAHQKRMK